MTKRQALKILLSDRWRVYRMSTWRKAAARIFVGPGQYDKKGRVL